MLFSLKVNVLFFIELLNERPLLQKLALQQLIDLLNLYIIPGFFPLHQVDPAIPAFIDWDRFDGKTRRCLFPVVIQLIRNNPDAPVLMSCAVALWSGYSTKTFGRTPSAANICIRKRRSSSRPVKQTISCSICAGGNDSIFAIG